MLQAKQWEEELALLAAILARAPLQVAIKWGAEVFTYQGKNVVSYGGFKNHFALWFFNGVFFKDKYGVLVSAQEGKTKSLRQWRFTNRDQINEKRILEYVMEAIEVEKKGLSIPAEKFKAAPLPEVLKEAFKKNKQLQTAFDKLTPGRQKEYILYLNEARQEATRQTRLQKIMPMILQGTGLNDKYK